MISITYPATANSSYPTWDSLRYTSGMSYAMWAKRCYIRDAVHEGKIDYTEIKKKNTTTTNDLLFKIQFFQNVKRYVHFFYSV